MNQPYLDKGGLIPPAPLDKGGLIPPAPLDKGGLIPPAPLDKGVWSPLPLGLIVGLIHESTLPW